MISPLKEKFVDRLSQDVHHYGWVSIRLMGRLLNDLKPRQETPTQLVAAFRRSKDLILSRKQMSTKAFTWALHDQDGRGSEFQLYDAEVVRRWLSWYQYRHFIWEEAWNEQKSEIAYKLLSLGRKTWKQFFRAYIINELDAHDSYSIPDIYYPLKTLGYTPDVTIDIGGGWGRLGMAWLAMGARVSAVCDSIEQPYILQNLYLSSVPDTNLYETLSVDEHPESSIPVQTLKGLLHFPFWDLKRIPDESVDLVSAVQVLREVNEGFMDFLFTQLPRILRKGGVFYIRDNDPTYQDCCMHKVNIASRLEELGFSLVCMPQLKQALEIHGIPRVYRWEGKKTITL